MVKSYIGDEMKNVFAEYDEKDSLYVVAYGTEDVSENAHWGKGRRNAYIIHYVLSGEGYYNGIKVKEGQGFFIRKGQMHEYASSDNKPWKYFWVILNGENAYETCKKYISFNKQGIFDYYFKSELINFVGNFFNKYKTASYAKAMGTFWLLMSFHEKHDKVQSNKYIIEAKKYMEQNYYRRVSICEVADMLYISDRYLYNLFVKHIGVSPKKYLNELRLNRACELLMSHHMSVTEVAMSVGFDDVLAFSRFFKKNILVSPTEYRKNIR